MAKLLFDRQWLPVTSVNHTDGVKPIDTFISFLTLEAVTVAQRAANYYLQKIYNEKTKLINTTNKEKKQSNVDIIIRAIENRPDNMIHRFQINMPCAQRRDYCTHKTQLK